MKIWKYKTTAFTALTALSSHFSTPGYQKERAMNNCRQPRNAAVLEMIGPKKGYARRRDQRFLGKA